MTGRTIARVTALLALGLAAIAAAAQTGSECRGPAQIENEVRAQPSAKTWGALAGWFGEHSQFACAIPAFRSALKFNPNSASLHYFLGLSLEGVGQADDSIPELQRSIELDPAQVKPRLLLGTVLYERGRNGDAQKAWEEALHVDPRSTIALDWLARARINDGEFDAAIDLLLSAPEELQLTLDLALAYSLSSQFDKAAETLQAGLSHHPGDSQLTSALATVYVQSHRYQEATALLRGLVEKHPRDEATRLLYLKILVMQEDSATARPLATRFLADHPGSFDALYMMGILEVDAQEFAKAADHLKAALALKPDHYDVRYNLGVALAGLGQNDGAAEQFKKSVELDPSQAQAHYHYSQVLRTLGRTDEAREQLKLFQQRQQATVDLALGETKSGQASQALKDGHPEQAVSLYEEAIKARPNDALLEYNFALALAKASGSIPDAAPRESAALEKAIEIQPGFALAHNRLGELKAEHNDLAGAESQFRAALSSVPRYAEAANNLGTVLGRQGRDTEAEVYFEAAVSANPRFTRAWINLAATLASQSRLTDAASAVSNAFKIEPANADALSLKDMIAKANHAAAVSPASPSTRPTGRNTP